jgi:fibronectin type III domain protein
VTVTVRNTGSRRGKEVIQLYASRAGSDVERPLRWLVGYAVVDAEPDEAVTATITVRPRAFEHYNAPVGDRAGGVPARRGGVVRSAPAVGRDGDRYPVGGKATPAAGREGATCTWMTASLGDQTPMGATVSAALLSSARRTHGPSLVIGPRLKR